MSERVEEIREALQLARSFGVTEGLVRSSGTSGSIAQKKFRDKREKSDAWIREKSKELSDRLSETEEKLERAVEALEEIATVGHVVSLSRGNARRAARQALQGIEEGEDDG